MGEASLYPATAELVISSTIFIYGDAAYKDLAIQIADNISTVWNEPHAQVSIHHHHHPYTLRFSIEGIYYPDLPPEEVWYNDNPRNNYFRIEEYSDRDISFVDDLGSNTGYFKIANLLQTPTTAAHEFGHTLGLEHPINLDIRGKGVPGIMFPRGTICDPQYQYDPNARAGDKGGTLDPQWRKVLPNDIEDLKISKLLFNSSNRAVVGGFTSLYHAKHLPDLQGSSQRG